MKQFFLIIVCVLVSMFFTAVIVESDLPMWLKLWLIR